MDGVRLHYTDRGSGQPIVLIHGNAVTGDDYDTSGVAGQLLETHRVIVFDRPGFGHSERPVVAGHSWGAIVALSLAVRHPADTAGARAVQVFLYWRP